MTLRSITAGAFILMATTLSAAPVESGLDVLVADQLDALRGKSIAIVCNHTALTRDGEHITDRLAREDGITVSALFGPEHGIRGTANAGARIEGDEDLTRGIPIYSLYDSTRGPQPDELEGVDVILFDIQDVGARFYTYISTMGHVMEAAAANAIPLVILDRPNMISGRHPEGPLCEPAWFSFVGRYPIPVRHALTIGELARMIVAEQWIEGLGELDLTVIPARGWSRAVDLDSVALPFVRPSPNIPSVESALVYPGTCFFEGVNVNEGRGTDTPFLNIGAPFIDSARWVEALEACDLPGIAFIPISYTPRPNAGASHPKREGELCHGVHLTVTDRETFRPVRTGLAMLWTLAELWPDDFTFNARETNGETRHGIDRLWGTSRVREAIEHHRTTGEGDWRAIADAWETDVAELWARAQPHLLYQ